MSINQIHLGPYPRTFISSTNHSNLQTNLASIIHNKLTHLNVPIIDIFLLINQFHAHKAGRTNERLVIFINGTEKTNENNQPIIMDNNATLFNIQTPFNTFLPPTNNGIVIKSNEGIAVAEWIEEYWELNILVDLFNDNVELDKKLNIFACIMEAFNKQVWYLKILENSWKHSNQRDKLYANFYSTLKDHRQHNIESDKRQIQQWESDIRTYQNAIKRVHDQLLHKRHQVIAIDNYLDEIISTLKNDLDILIQNEKITDVHINNEIITVFTEPLRIYASNNKIYQGGRYTININMFTSEILFDSDYKNKSFWSMKDPHPHVDGTTKKACLGNIESTVAELCSQMQLYALVMILIDFLESVNLADVAGKCVVNWPEIDKDGNPVNHDDNDCCNKEEEENDDAYRDCDCCYEAYHIEDLYEVYEEVEMENNIFQPVCLRHVCEDCRDEHYYWCDEFEVYLANDAEYDN